MQENLRYGPSRNVFGGPGIVSLVDEGEEFVPGLSVENERNIQLLHVLFGYACARKKLSS